MNEIRAFPGYPDLIVINRLQPNEYYINDGAGGFRVAPACDMTNDHPLTLNLDTGDRWVGPLETLVHNPGEVDFDGYFPNVIGRGALVADFNNDGGSLQVL